jgi:hypothetical protein
LNYRFLRLHMIIALLPLLGIPSAVAQNAVIGNNSARRTALSISYEVTAYASYILPGNLLGVCSVSGSYTFTHRYSVRLSLGSGIMGHREQNINNGITFTLQGDCLYRISDSSNSTIFAGITAIKPKRDLLFIASPRHDDQHYYSSNLLHILHLTFGMTFALGRGCSADIFTRIPFGANLQGGKSIYSNRTRYIMMGFTFNINVGEW